MAPSQPQTHLTSLSLSLQRVVCTAGLKWYPHPALIHCVKGCEPFMGDNYCDAINNRAFCNYDGGDCCASTVKTKKVGQCAPLGSQHLQASQLARITPTCWTTRCPGCVRACL
ncbi:hypothetical protein HPG69_013491 [Diceros bicornis minor]|uniref:LNR domain-containing protein n=1 Tax=Diceros bicornis minor TaxID=77932 RepID=A0A7J7EPC8_DICBM|nr:hypothetical protein HPG69_013491 [Diceros bicornis minor]